LNALVPDMVSRERLPKATAIGQTASSVGMLLAPALGGLLVGQFGLRVPLLIDAATYLAVTVAGVLIRTRRGGVPAGAGAEDVTAGVLLGRRVPPDVRGRAFALFSGAANGANALGYLIAGLALAAVSARTMIALAGGVGLVAALAFAVPMWRATRRTDQPAAVL